MSRFYGPQCIFIVYKPCKVNVAVFVIEIIVLPQYMNQDRSDVRLRDTEQKLVAH